MRTPVKLQVRCLSGLDNADVEIIDAKIMKRWRDISKVERGLLEMTAKQGALAKSTPIRLGLHQGKADRKRIPTNNHERATKAAALKAERRANKLFGFVGEWQKHQPSEKKRSGSALAHALNAADILSPQGKSWSPNSAKNLLSRYEAISQVKQT